MKKAKDWFPNDKATHEWLDSMKKSSRATYQTMWKYFLKFTTMTGDRILESRKADKDYTWEKRVVEFKQWMIDAEKQSEKSAALGRRQFAVSSHFIAFLCNSAGRKVFAFERLSERQKTTGLAVKI